MKNASLLCLGHQKRGISFANGLDYFLQLVDLSNDDDCADSHRRGQPQLAAAQTEDFIANFFFFFFRSGKLDVGRQVSSKVQKADHWPARREE